MTVRELSEALSLQVLAGQSGLDNQVSCCYIGDLLSWVMGRAPEQAVWITVMGNINALAVAQLADIACILLCEGSTMDDNVPPQAEANCIPVLSSQETAYALALKVAALLGDVVNS